MASFHDVRVALSDGEEERTSDFRTRVLGGHGTVAAIGSACDAIQGYASIVEAKDLCKQHGLQVSTRFDLRDPGDRAAGISARAWSAQHPCFMNAERSGTPCCDAPFLMVEDRLRVRSTASAPALGASVPWSSMRYFGALVNHYFRT